MQSGRYFVGGHIPCALCCLVVTPGRCVRRRGGRLGWAPVRRHSHSRRGGLSAGWSLPVSGEAPSVWQGLGAPPGI